MNQYTLKVQVEHGHIEKIWSGNEMSEAIHYKGIAVKRWGKENVWVCDNIQEVICG